MNGDAKACGFQGLLQISCIAQDMTENMTVETETAKTYREMRARDPAFDMIKFLRALKQDVQPVIQARALCLYTFSRSHHVAMPSACRWHGCSCAWPAWRIADRLADCKNQTETVACCSAAAPQSSACVKPYLSRASLRMLPRRAQAYLKADVGVLQQHCSPEAVERLTSIVKAEHAQVRITACPLSAGS